MSAVEVTPLSFDFSSGLCVYSVVVPTETGGRCQVDVTYDEFQDTYGVEFSGELLKQAPQAITATVQMALLAIQEQVLS